jgi:hypothetical protein
VSPDHALLSAVASESEAKQMKFESALLRSRIEATTANTFYVIPSAARNLLYFFVIPSTARNLLLRQKADPSLRSG